MKGSNIVVATDLSDNSAVAARWAHQLASTYGMSVVVTYVVEISISSWASGAYDILDDPTNFQRALDRVNAWYVEKTGARPDDVDVCVGAPVDQLEEAVEDYDAAMLVASMSGKTAMTRVFVGSTAQSLASDPPCPVTIVHADFESLGDPPRLVVGCDFSANSDRAVDYAAKFAGLTGSSLDIVHADTAPELDFIDDEDIQPPPDEDDHRKWAAEEMKALEERLSDTLEPIDYQLHIIHDTPSRGLLGFAADNDADLILVGRSGQSQLVGALLGSVMNALLQSMPCSTLVVPLDAQ